MQVKEIVDNINYQLKTSFENISSLVSGIAEPIIIREDGDVNVESKDIYQPAIICNDGECHNVFIDDDYSLGIYHKLNAKTYETLTNKGYGDGLRNICTADLSLICWGFKNSVCAEDLENLIISKFPKDVKIVSTDFDRKRVFSSEFQGINFFLPPDVFLFSIKYKVQFEIKKSCLEINEIFN